MLRFGAVLYFGPCILEMVRPLMFGIHRCSQLDRELIVFMFNEITPSSMACNEEEQFASDPVRRALIFALELLSSSRML